MNQLVIDNHIIKRDIVEILSELKRYASPGKLKSVKNQGDNYRVTCPVHKDGQENTPSCDIYVGTSENVVWGTTHCFACGFKGQLYNLVAEVCDKDVNWGKRWLKDNFTEAVIEQNEVIIDQPINLKKDIKKTQSINDDFLKDYQSWHPYMQERKLTKEVCQRFEVKYDPASECIVFPVRDIKGNLKFLTRRSIISKKFIIDKDVEKEVYLLNEIVKQKIKTVIITESQINCLTCWGYGLPAVALLGTGSDYQYNLLKKSGILHYILCFDGDEAGRKGVNNFIKSMPDNIFITVIQMPDKKDVNDLDKDTFLDLLYKKGVDYKNLSKE